MSEYDALNCKKETGRAMRALAQAKGMTLVDLIDEALKLLKEEATPAERKVANDLTRLDENRDR